MSVILIYCVNKLFHYRTGDELLRKAFTNTLNYCDIYFTYITIYMVNLLNKISSGNAFNRVHFGIGGTLKLDNFEKFQS